MKRREHCPAGYSIDVRCTPNAAGEYLYCVYGCSPHGSTLLAEGYDFSRAAAEHRAVNAAKALKERYGY